MDIVWYSMSLRCSEKMGYHASAPLYKHPCIYSNRTSFFNQACSTILYSVIYVSDFCRGSVLPKAKRRTEECTQLARSRSHHSRFINKEPSRTDWEWDHARFINKDSHCSTNATAKSTWYVTCYHQSCLGTSPRGGSSVYIIKMISLAARKT